MVPRSENPGHPVIEVRLDGCAAYTLDG